MKIGLLGGSFDPVHCGHLKIAEKVLNTLNLDKIWFLPTGKHPFKKNRIILSFLQRIKLVQKAISNNDLFAVKDFDACLENFNYTDELIKKLYKKYPTYKFYFIIGEDNVEELKLWHNYQWLLQNVKFAVISRADIDKKRWNLLDYVDKLRFITMKPIDISSSMIRKNIKSGKSIKKMVPQSIETEIIKLYKEYLEEL